MDYREIYIKMGLVVVALIVLYLFTGKGESGDS